MGSYETIREGYFLYETKCELIGIQMGVLQFP